MVRQEIKKTREMEKFHCYILFEEVKEKVRMLKSYGIGDDEIDTLLHDDEIFPKLTITKDYKIVIGGNELHEVEMEPLVKTIYLLFLAHPEGIVLKCLPDYQKEIKDIYLRLKPQGLSDRIERSIASVSNPMQNSINEKCARIRAAFITQFDESLAHYYYINGNRGEAKKIALPRDLVIWE